MSECGFVLQWGARGGGGGYGGGGGELIQDRNSWAGRYHNGLCVHWHGIEMPVCHRLRIRLAVGMATASGWRSRAVATVHPAPRVRGGVTVPAVTGPDARDSVLASCLCGQRIVPMTGLGPGPDIRVAARVA